MMRLLDLGLARPDSQRNARVYLGRMSCARLYYGTTVQDAPNLWAYTLDEIDAYRKAMLKRRDEGPGGPAYLKAKGGSILSDPQSYVALGRAEIQKIEPDRFVTESDSISIDSEYRRIHH